MVERDPALKQAEQFSSPERIIDISPLHPIEKRFIEQFPGQPELQSIHCVMTFGIIARDCKIPYILNNPDAPTSSRYSDKPLEFFSQLLERIKLAGEIKEGTVSPSHEIVVLWGEMHQTMHELRVVDPKRPSLSKKLFTKQLELAIERNDNFYKRKPVEVSEHEKAQLEEKLRNVAHDVRTASELIVCDKLNADDLGQLIEQSQQLDQQVWSDFSDEYYWRGNDPFRSFPANLRNPTLVGLTLNMRNAHRAIQNNA